MEFFKGKSNFYKERNYHMSYDYLVDLIAKVKELEDDPLFTVTIPTGWTCPEGHHFDFAARSYGFNLETGETLSKPYCSKCKRYYDK